MDYLVSDIHLDHANIIGYCDRPFDSAAAMNGTLVENWNATIDPGDEVLYGGDLTVRSAAAALLDWLEELHGEPRVNTSVELLGYRPLSLGQPVDYPACGERFADRTAARALADDDGRKADD